MKDGKIMNKAKKKCSSLVMSVCVFVLFLACSMWAFLCVSAEEVSTEEVSAGSEDYIDGKTDDINISALGSVKGNAGETISMSFVVSGTDNTSKNYTVNKIEKVYPDTDSDDFPFVTNSEAYKVTYGSGNSVSCSYKLKAKDNIESGYYPVKFIVIYTRTGINGNNKKYSDEYTVTRKVNVKITNQENEQKEKEQEAKEKSKTIKAEDADVSVIIRSGTKGKYGQHLKLNFDVKSDQYNITSVVPVVDDDFIFQSTSEAYKVLKNNDKKISCNYDFIVKDSAATGNYATKFKIYYEKSGELVNITKELYVSVMGKKKKTGSDSKKEEKTSVPRLMVTNYRADREHLFPGDKFSLAIDVKNTSEKEIKNVKFTLSTGSGEFLPYDSAGTAYISGIRAGGTAQLDVRLKASTSLKNQMYQICVHSEYEDAQNNSYEATDYISVQIELKDEISLSDITKPKKFHVGTTGDFTLLVNNTGKSDISNVTIKVEGEGFSCEKTFVGNIKAGESSYADLILTGQEQTNPSEKNTKIIVKYQNSSGEEKEFVKKIKLKVNGEEASDLETVVEQNGSDSHQSLPRPVKILVIFAGIGMVTAVVIYWNKKRKAAYEKYEI